MNNILLELRARPFPHRMCMAEILKQGSVASVPSKWNNAVLRKPMIKGGRKVHFSFGDSSHPRGLSSKEPWEILRPGSGGLLPLRARALPTFRVVYWLLDAQMERYAGLRFSP